MAKKVLITGIAGFVGSHLAELLLAEGHEVYGLVRPRSKTDYIEPILNKLHLEDADLMDMHSLYLLVPLAPLVGADCGRPGGGRPGTPLGQPIARGQVTADHLRPVGGQRRHAGPERAALGPVKKSER